MQRPSTSKLKVCLVFDHDSQKLLPELLASQEYELTLLSIDQATPLPQKQLHHPINFKLIQLDYAGPPISTLAPALRPYHLLQWFLKHASSFDIIYFPLSKGVAYYTLLAKHQGWAFQSLQLLVYSNTCTLWHKHKCNQWLDHLDDLAYDFLERESFALADGALVPDQSLLDWINKHEWKHPSVIFTSIQEYRIQTPPPLQIREKGSEHPLVSVCITHFNRPHYLKQALESIRAQTYSPFEVVLVDDASTQPEAIAYLDSLTAEFQSKKWTIIRNPKNLFPGAARNLAARHSKGKYLLFMDDDNYAQKNEISTFVQVAEHTGADILTCAMDVFKSDLPSVENFSLIHRFLPMGAATSLGLYLNMFGDMNALIKRNVYVELNGLTEEKGIGGEDWEFFSRAALKGYHLEVIPQSLFWYRDTPHSITKSTHLLSNSLRGIAPFLQAIPSALRLNLILGQAQQDRLQQLIHDQNNINKLLCRCLHLFFNRVKRRIIRLCRFIQKRLRNLGLEPTKPKF